MNAGRSIAWLAASLMLAHGPAVAAVNSYRFLHVTIDTPWYIFVFLLMGVFAPFVLMVVLMWRNTGRRPDRPSASGPNTGRRPGP
jgi:hypothetical protein